MRTLDETDREILRLLLADARRPFSDIADRVDLSAPAVSDRIDRLRETGVIEGFTLRVDADELSSGLEVLVTLDVAPVDAEAAYESLAGHDHVEHATLTADGDVTALARVPDDDVRGFVDGTVGLGSVRDLTVRVVDRQEWSPGLGDADLAVDCVECDNTVTAEGESERIDGTLYHFCCGSCRRNFLDRYERLDEGT
ncbi:DNA-binding Lrp family transcriptional regulator [Halorubrum alkaliphilum]|uniref:DNA-binding Lrp family transcriptional regulator n=1 Tax=Halorubrum alkaliphilum TaxID=261290 RepID=A0A8T4GIF4_9EURY|nr:winged helix-turn-helix transcriptional regulator [Halorubrum alkaliphilum]MBP1923509.1 DNA-binding Lrp family transcriptional regulator [Halorubrum alkaliphilum]